MELEKNYCFTLPYAYNKAIEAACFFVMKKPLLF